MTSVCSICIQRKQRVVPVVWCPICEEGFCSTCKDHHQLSKLSKDHIAIPFEDYQLLPSFILNVRLFCQEHDEKYQYFCRNHDQPICGKCIVQTHKKCQDTPILDDILHHVKTSVPFDDVFTQLNGNRQILLRIIKDRQGNLSELLNKKKDMMKIIEGKSEDLIKHIIELKEKSLFNIQNSITIKEHEIEDLVKKLTSKEQSIQKIIEQKEAIKQYASNYQTFIGVREMENVVSYCESSLKELSDQGKLDKINVELEENVEEILRIKSFGEVRVSHSPLSVPIETKKMNKAQIEKIGKKPEQLQLIQKINEKGGTYWGGCTLPNGLMVLPAYETNYINIINADGSLKSKIIVNDGMYDVTGINQTQFAVSEPGSMTISIIDTTTDKIVKTLTTQYQASGITYTDGNIIFCVKKKGLMRLSIDTGEAVEVFCDECVDFHSHIKANSLRICYTCPDLNIVTVIDSSYRPIFKYQNDTLLKEPFGISMDEHMNVFVVGYKSHNLVVLSLVDNICTRLLSSTDGLSHPSAVHYDITKNQLMIVNYMGDVFRYSLA